MPCQAPPGIKKNLLRTFESWAPAFFSEGGNVVRSQALFALAWFHAVCQERRNFIPQVRVSTTVFVRLSCLLALVAKIRDL